LDVVDFLMWLKQGGSLFVHCEKERKRESVPVIVMVGCVCWGIRIVLANWALGSWAAGWVCLIC